MKRTLQPKVLQPFVPLAARRVPVDRTLTAEFFNRDVRTVARAVLGKVLLRDTPGAVLAGRIVETEAYLGTGDAAAHAAAGRTARNEVIFGPPGRAYVYFIYGNHFCLNVSCLPEGDPGCILIRALEPLSGIDAMARSRGLEVRTERDLRNISSGPGRLAQAFGITRDRDNGKDLVSKRSDLRLVDDGYRVQQIEVTPRIGIIKAASEPLRFLIAGNGFVSGPRLHR